MHPDKRVIALKAGLQLQVLNLEKKQKLKLYQMWRGALSIDINWKIFVLLQATKGPKSRPVFNFGEFMAMSQQV